MKNLFILVILISTLNATFAQDSYKLAVCNTNEIAIDAIEAFIGGQETQILQFQLMKNTKYQLRFSGNSEIRVSVNSVSIFLTEERTIEITGEEICTIYVHNISKKKNKIAIVLIYQGPNK